MNSATRQEQFAPARPEIKRAKELILSADYEAADGILARLPGAEALLHRARIRYRRTQWREALGFARAARESARLELQPVIEGRALHIHATALSELGMGEPGDKFKAAISLLAGEDLARSYAEADYAAFVLGLGDHDEARRLYGAARATADRHGDTGRGLEFDAASLMITYSEGRYLETYETAARVAARARAEKNTDPLGQSLRFRALSALALSSALAVPAAEEYAAVAAGFCDWDRVVAPLILTRARVDAGDRSALDRFPELVVDADRVEGPAGVVARLWQWAATLATSPARALEGARALYVPAARDRRVFVRLETRAVDRLSRPVPLVTENGEPRRFADVEADTEAALYLCAYQRTHGCFRQMQEHLGRDRKLISRKMRSYGLEPAGKAGRKPKALATRTTA